MKTCARKDCTNPGGWRPVLILRAASRPNEPARAELGIAVCEHHARTGQVDDFVSDEGWAQISNAFAASGRERPARALTSLEFEAIS